MEWKERIVTNPEILSGQPAVKGTGLSVSLILDLLAARSGEADILAAYPQLGAADIRACLRYASERIAPQKVSPISNLIAGESIPQEARAILVKADERFQRYDFGAGSLLLWQAVEWAIKDVAARRGWLAGNERELEQTIERLGDEANDENEKFHLIAGFGNALEVRDNADGQYLSPGEAEFYAELMPPFIASIFAAAGAPA